ncbi:MAG TPA: isoprenylcysteine carboxylmethyltransferase family protein [Polyangiaceae bacterium]|nr:isoprenylcysteine carboxylmethyltransferase family protein [Polyangiaceae bacterium]
MRSPAARIARSTAKTLVVLATLLFAAAGTLRFWQAWGYLALNRENTHASSVIEVGAGQTVVSSGPYRFVRHPMYVAAIVMALATPLSLGSTWAMSRSRPASRWSRCGCSTRSGSCRASCRAIASTCKRHAAGCSLASGSAGPGRRRNPPATGLTPPGRTVRTIVHREAW